MSTTIAIYKDFLTTGRGADRAVCAFANAMVTYGYQVHIIVQQRSSVPLSVTFDPAVSCHHIRMSRIRSAAGSLNKLLLRSVIGERILRRVFPWIDLMRETSQRLRTCLAEIAPDLVVSAGTNECVELTYCGKLPMPLVQMFHVYPPVCFAKNKYQRVTRLRRALQNVDAIQVLLPSHRTFLSEICKAPVTAIGNAISFPVEEFIPPPSARDRTIVYVAYFTKDKNQLDLIDAFALLKEREEWELCLYGSGTREWENRLRERIAARGISSRVRLFGIAQTPRNVLLHASICAFPSLTEGFGLALVEAMWCGLPCVGFQSSPGVNELMVHEANGLLAASSAESFAAQLERLVRDATLRERLGTAAARTVRTMYAPARIWQQWDDFLHRVLASSKLNCQ
ncbi:MAG: glycosyltransferase [Kiritimatiellia bacterium]